MQRRQQHGYILVMVLFILPFITLTSFNDCFMNVRSSKTLQRFLTHTHRDQYLKKAMQRLANDLKENKLDSCLVPIQSMHSLLTKPFSWWQKFACHNQSDQKIYYALEPLGKNDCYYVMNQNKIANFYRITLLSKEAPYYKLQASIVRPVAMIERCEGKKYFVSAGIQAYRFLK